MTKENKQYEAHKEEQSWHLFWVAFSFLFTLIEDAGCSIWTCWSTHVAQTDLPSVEIQKGHSY